MFVFPLPLYIIHLSYNVFMAGIIPPYPSGTQSGYVKSSSFNAKLLIAFTFNVAFGLKTSNGCTVPKKIKVQ